MTKAIPKIGSRKKVRIGLRRNARFSLRKSARRITKGVIHVQASFNNTIITVTDPQGRVVFWSSAGTCGFKSSRKASPYAGQRTAVDAIRTVGLQTSLARFAPSYVRQPNGPECTRMVQNTRKR